MKHHQKVMEGKKIQYYRSKANGRIYYRDPKTHQAVWVTKAKDEKQEYELDEAQQKEISQYKGYKGSDSGQEYEGEKDTEGGK